MAVRLLKAVLRLTVVQRAEAGRSAPVAFPATGQSNVSYNAQGGGRGFYADVAQFSCRDFFIVAGSRTIVTAHGA
jgi:hypothetical protein